MIKPITSSKGFTLMELMVAAIILTVTLAGLIAMFTANFALVDSGRSLTVAMNHARCVAEEMRSRNIPLFITNQNWSVWAQADLPVGGGCNSLNNENIQVAYPSGAAANPLEVLITVNWTERGRPRSAQLATLVTER